MRELATEHVADDFHVTVAVRAKALPGLHASSLITRSGPQ
jgi:hypothetical protein